MNRGRLIGSSIGGSSAYTAMLGLMMGANHHHKSKLNELTVEERAEFKNKLKERRDEERRCLLIRKGICPSCQTKLVRGKKDKNMNYKRQWNCIPCDQIHYA